MKGGSACREAPRTLFPTTQSGAISFSGGGRRYGEDGRRTTAGERGGEGERAAMEKDQEPRSAERSERERRQFFKIKAVKPNLQVCRRKRVEVVKILVCRIRARNPLLPPSRLSSLSFLLFHAPFQRLSSDVVRTPGLPCRWLNCRTKRS